MENSSWADNNNNNFIYIRHSCLDWSQLREKKKPISISGCFTITNICRFHPKLQYWKIEIKDIDQSSWYDLLAQRKDESKKNERTLKMKFTIVVVPQGNLQTWKTKPFNEGSFLQEEKSTQRTHTFAKQLTPWPNHPFLAPLATFTPHLTQLC